MHSLNFSLIIHVQGTWILLKRQVATTGRRHHHHQLNSSNRSRKTQALLTPRT
ncbi:hypothetical protein VFPPC_17773 [Pochonia chlamydosporia 170]|uniref:Uncharacterized protein n=1 Tax=Pochonia chlamydosporia 170 TaxID=1380566 RepID=A0A219AQM0_METCM|nr:hypothetical protein VFPPC_17773 [Pochonia chlamydosporia 170]OWT43051.1 hypothetical protein VFPPC_17773 [Pochonia chlamydosporia 170]